MIDGFRLSRPFNSFILLDCACQKRRHPSITGFLFFFIFMMFGFMPSRKEDHEPVETRHPIPDKEKLEPGKGLTSISKLSGCPIYPTIHFHSILISHRYFSLEIIQIECTSFSFHFRLFPRSQFLLMRPQAWRILLSSVLWR